LILRAASAVAVAPEMQPFASAEVCVALSKDENVAVLNGQYRGKPKPTNVLSFPAAMPNGAPSQPRRLGDIIFAIETILREANEQGLTPGDHLQHLTVHGLLHLCGFDHETEAQANVMESVEIAILARLGIANPYEEPLQPSETRPESL
jgi:probable rRNA maturation factor